KPVGDLGFDAILAKNPSDGSTPNQAGNYELRIESGSRLLNFLYQQGGENDTALVFSEAPVEEGVWSHVSVTVVAGGEIRFRINGQDAGSGTVANTFGIPNTSPLFIGTRNNRETTMDGHLDE